MSSRQNEASTPGGLVGGRGRAIERCSDRELLAWVDWYRRCLEDVQAGRVVRGLGEAKVGYDRAMAELKRRLGYD